MHTGKGQILELVLRDGIRHARIACAAGLIPSPGQYLLTGAASDLALPDPVYYTDPAPDGFLASSVPDQWMPGHEISLRGPLGRGFVLPTTARRIALIPFNDVSRLYPLIRPALNQRAAVVLVNNSSHDHLSDDVEVQPLSALGEILSWADWIAMDVAREDMPGLRDLLGRQKQSPALRDAEVLIRTPVPCGGIAECGVCGIASKSGWKMACREGPVFIWGGI